MSITNDFFDVICHSFTIKTRPRKPARKDQDTLLKTAIVNDRVCKSPKCDDFSKVTQELEPNWSQG